MALHITAMLMTLKLAKAELFVIPACPSINHNLQLGSTTLKLTGTDKNHWVTFNEKPNFTDHISTTAHSCRFILYNIKTIKSYLTDYAIQLLVQAFVLSNLDYCNAVSSFFVPFFYTQVFYTFTLSTLFLYHFNKKSYIVAMLVLFSAANNCN